MRQITPVLLCGGSGTRLWPLSRKSYPKQFARFGGGETLLQATARRFAAPGFGPPLAITLSDFRFIVTGQLAEAGIDPAAVLIEPERRNTAPAVLAAALWLVRADPGALMLIAPSDHAVPDPAGFRAAVLRGLPAAEAGQIVTFGIAPRSAETGYGYLELATPPDGDGPVPLARFVEKPDAAHAAAMLASGRHLWNAGLVLARADTILTAAAAHVPDLVPPVTAALDAAAPDLDFLRLASGPWAGLPDISIDHAVMERAENLSVVPWRGHWSDLGGWTAIWREAGPDSAGVVTAGPATAIDCARTLLRSESPGQEIVGIGLEDVIAVAMPDAVLVARMDRAQEVRRAVAALKAKGALQAETFPRHDRPWGWFETLAGGTRFQVKRIVVEPGAALSLQSHVHRAEHWIIVEGTARVTIDGAVSLLAENQSAYIPLGARHRLENPGRLPVVLIEVQTGAYLGEDDIIRYEDAYARR